MKTDKFFKMSKSTKILLANIQDASHKSVCSKLFTEAEYQASHSKKKMLVKHVETEPEN
jgi:hypothetical protein